jgi:hypothetical protein
MHLTEVQDQAIQARMALIVGANTFDRFFAGVRFDEVDGDLLFVYAKDENCAAQIEDNYALHISIVATDILKRYRNSARFAEGSSLVARSRCHGTSAFLLPPML